MRATLLNRAAITAHKHQPLIRFIGPRKELWKQKAAELASKKIPLVPASPIIVSPASNNSALGNYFDLPEKYRYMRLSEAEAEAIESGGASVF